MLLTKCVRQNNIIKCLNKSIISSTIRRGVAVTSITRNKPQNLAKTAWPCSTSMAMFKSSYQHNLYQCRYYSNESNDQTKKDDPINCSNPKISPFGDSFLVAPSIYLKLKNALSTLFIRSYFDETFNKNEFLAGAQHAVEVVSHMLAAGNFDGLEDMVDDDTIDRMRKIVGLMTPQERSFIAVEESNVWWIFPYEIQFITKDSAVENKSRFFVEIMVVVHAYRGAFDDIFDKVDQKQDADEVKKAVEDFETNFSIVNYRFIKEFTKDVEDDWTINHISHVKLQDEMKGKLFKFRYF